jgi:uncharacterized membrane protein
LLLIVAISLAVRLHNIARLSLHYDEAWTLERSTGRGSMQGSFESGRIYHGITSLTSLRDAPPWWQIWTSLGGVTQPPLFPLVLRAWRALGAGDSDVACRALSAILSSTALVFFYDAVRTRHGTAPALYAAAIMALASPQIELSQEIRPYTLLVLLGCGACAALLRIEVHGSNRLRVGAVFACVLAMMLTHYYAIGAVAAIFLYSQIAMRGRPRRDATVATLLALVIFAITWGPMLLHQRAAFGDADNALRDRSGNGILATAQRLAQLPLRLLFEPRERVSVAAYGGSVLLLTPLLLLRGRRDLLLWILWAGGVIGVVAVLDVILQTWQLMLIRYTLLAGPAIYAILVIVLPANRLFARHAVSAAVALGCAMALPGAYTRPQADYRPLASYLAQHVAPGEVLVFYRSNDAAWYGRVLYLGVAHYTGPREWSFVVLDEPPNESLASQLQSAPGVWLISGVGAIEPEKLFPGAHGLGAGYFPYLATCEHILPRSKATP